MRDPYLNFSSDSMPFSRDFRDLEKTPDRPTDRPTDQPTKRRTDGPIDGLTFLEVRGQI